jgi:hypothetical protein
VTGGKALVNSAGDTIGGVIGWDIPDIPVDPNTDIGYDSSRLFADIGTKAAFAAATAGVSCASALGKAVNIIDAAGGAVGAAQGIADLAENGISAQNITQTALGLLDVALGFKNCFPAGTPVSTESGQRPIEEVRAGDRVWAYSLSEGKWQLRPVTETYEFVNEDFVELRIDGPDGKEDKITSTAGHPFWVVRGEDLDSRPRPEHIQAAEQELRDRNSVLAGRWVDAGDLLPGDVLFLRDGRQVRVDAVELFQERQLTYNFAVDDLHCFAVGELGILVHNSCGSKELADNLEAAGHIRPANSAAHHIVAENAKRAQLARNILAREGIDINDAANGVFLPLSRRVASGAAAVHSVLHTRRYYAAINELLSSAAPGTVRQVLDDIRTQLLNGTFPY